MRVLRTSGVESESPLAFPALLWPLRGRLEDPPAPQRMRTAARQDRDRAPAAAPDPPRATLVSDWKPG
jgi:hypothetical protein